MSNSPDQRKLAAIMFTDMVGFSALSQRDEALALELLEEQRGIVRGILTRHRGREVKTMGDGFLLEFPSALSAVQAAVEIQKSLNDRNLTAPEREVQLRIGIHVGDVVRRKRDIHGDGVNIASRLEPLAKPGGICVSEDVARAVRNKIANPLVPLRATALKNIELPTAVYRVMLPWEGGGAAEAAAMSKPIAAATTIWAALAVFLLGGLALAYWQPWKRSTPAVESVSQPAKVSEARQLLAKARQLFEREDDSNRENLLLADDLLRRAEGLDPTDGEIWAAHAQLSGVFISLAYDRSSARYAAIRTQAERAMKLAPDSVESRLAKAWYLTSQANTLAEGEKVLADLIKSAPGDWRPLRIMGHTVRRLGRFDEGISWLDRAAAFPEDAAVAQLEKATVLFSEGRIGEGQLALEESLKVRPLGRALLLKVIGLTLWEGDLEAAKRTVEQMPSSLMLEDRGAFLAYRVWLWRREPAKCLAVLAGVPRDFLEDQYFQGPKAFLVAATHKLAGRPDAARPEWERALRLIEDRLRNNPSDTRLLCEKAVCLVELNKPEEAEAALRACQQAGNCDIEMWPGGGVAGVLLKLGRPAAAMDEIEASMVRGVALFNSRAVLELNPDFDPLRNDPRFQQLLAKAPGPVRAVAPSVKPDQKSVAVLAFTNLSDDKQNEYFSDGISEELLNVLSKVQGLKVSARTSAFFFKGKQVPIAEIAKQLGVAYVVEGSVRKSGDRVRITAQLINAADGFHVWSDKFDREAKDVFAVQDEIAALIARNLQLKIGSTGGTATLVNADALQLYLQARQEWNLRTKDGFDRAEELLQQAIKLEPNLARAHAALADVWAFRLAQFDLPGATFGRRDSAEIRRVVAQAEKAVALDSQSAEAHASLGLAHMFSWRFDEAVQEMRRAVALNPNYASARQWLGTLLKGRGRMDEAIAEMARAVELDPLSHRILDNYARTLDLAGRESEALAAVDRAVALKPDSPQAQGIRSLILVRLGRTVEGVALARLALGDASRQIDSPFVALGAAGQTADVREFLANPARPVTPYMRFLGLVALGQSSEATRVMTPNDFATGNMDTVLYDPILDPVREDPQFGQMITTIGFAEANARVQAWRATRTSAPSK